MRNLYGARIAHAINSVETHCCANHGHRPWRVLRMLLIALKHMSQSCYTPKNARIAHAINSVETSMSAASAQNWARIAHAINSVET